MKSLSKLLAIILLIIGLGSCSTSSNVPGELHPEVVSDSFAYLSPEAIVHASTLSNLISTFPKFDNQTVNQEIGVLKTSLTDYLLAIRNFNQNKKQKAVNNFEVSYKKVQKLRKLLSKDNDATLNRYLVKIKTTMNLLENCQSKESTTSPN